jgi:F-type H+-transporting ATPase subunit alpha
LLFPKLIKCYSISLLINFLNFLEARHADVLVAFKAGKYTDELTDVLRKVAKEIADKY